MFDQEFDTIPLSELILKECLRRKWFKFCLQHANEPETNTFNLQHQPNRGTLWVISHNYLKFACTWFHQILQYNCSTEEIVYILTLMVHFFCTFFFKSLRWSMIKSFPHARFYISDTLHGFVSMDTYIWSPTFIQLPHFP